jgi:alcohol dehydrogenase
MELTSFSISRLPRIEFGEGVFAKLPEILSRYGRHILIVTGAKSFQLCSQWTWLEDAMQAQAMTWDSVKIEGEPSPQLIDELVSGFRDSDFDVVLGIGGGSVLDAAKAIAGLLKPGNSVMDHLEGVGPELPYIGPATPFIAVPTTAGTGSEATKNAVLSIQGESGFKKSFRDELLVPEYAVLDPMLLKSCPKELIAANGMDALTQLMESYVSIKANPMIDALAISGIEAVRESLLQWYEQGTDAHDSVREKMAYAALLSGITLAQVGLGSVHGLASPLGAFFPIPHGTVCGTLVATATKMNINAMRERDNNNIALEKYAKLGSIMTGKLFDAPEQAQDALVKLLVEWTERLALPRLGVFGVVESDVQRIVANSRGSSMKTNPIVLTDEEIAELIKARL